jgi:hypothetical protein
MVATLLLIIVLRWFEGSYQGMLYGAAIRAMVVERFSNLELTDQIQARFEFERLWLPRIILYAGFEGAVIWLAFALLPGHYLWTVPLIIGTIAESWYYYGYISPERHRRKYGTTDWALDQLECKPGDQIRIMVTNLSPVNDLTWPKRAWEIINSDGTSVYSPPVTPNLKVEPNFSYVWNFNVPQSFNPGIYRIIVYKPGKEDIARELARKLFVRPPLNQGPVLAKNRRHTTLIPILSC